MIELKKKQPSTAYRPCLKTCAPGDVVYLTKQDALHGTTISAGDPMLVLDMQDYQLFVHKYTDTLPTDDNSVAVVNLRTARLHKLHGTREVAYYAATLEYNE